MVKIMSSKETTLQKLESPVHEQEKRTYLGMSILGHECTRFLWFTFRWAYTATYTDRQRRLFNRGHREEDVIIENLEKIGIVVTGRQAEFVHGFGHIRGHCDGMCQFVPEAPKTQHLLEIKTMNDRNFKDVCKKGVKASKPGYYGQCQVGMGGFDLTRTLFIAVNKNDDAYYVERIYYNRETSDMLLKRGVGVVLSEIPHTKMYKPTWFLCKLCDAASICHYGQPMDVNCRTCKYVAPAQSAEWECTKHKMYLHINTQIKGCEDYEAIIIA